MKIHLSHRQTLLAAAVLVTAITWPLLAAELPGHLLTPTQVEPISAEDFTKVLEHHEGKVVLVNLWATWCIPCVQELPDIDLLQQRYGDRGLQVLAVSFDRPKGLEDKVRPFFKKRAPNLVSYLQLEASDYDFVSTLDPDWLGGLPTTFFIDRSGEIAESHIGRMTYQQLEKNVLALLE